MSSSPLRKDSILRKPSDSQNFILSKDAPTKHVHVIPAGVEVPVEVQNWIGAVEVEFPYNLIPSEACSKVPHVQFMKVPPRIKASPNGWCLLRIIQSRMIWEEKNYQLVVRFCGDSVVSCQGDMNGSVLDYYLL